MIKDLFYQFPLAAYLLFFVPLFLGIYWYLFVYIEKKKREFAPVTLWKDLIIAQSSMILWIKTIFLCLAWIFLTLALMDPQGYGKYLAGDQKDFSAPIHKRKPHEIVLLIDVSASMNVADMPNQRKRFDVAKEIADELIGSLRGESVSLYAFTNQLIPLSPSSYDYLYTRLMLRQLQINEAGTSGTTLLNTFMRLKKEFDRESKELTKSLILLTDGEDTSLQSLQEAEKEKRLRLLNVTIQNMNEENHVRLFAVAIGSDKGGIVPNVTFENKPVISRLEKSLLQEMAKAGRGKIFEVSSQSMRALAKEIAFDYKQEDASKVTEMSKISPDLIHDRYYQYPLGIALLFLTLKLLMPSIIRGWTKRN